MFLSLAILALIAGISCAVFGFLDDQNWAKITGIIAIALETILFIAHFNTAQGARDLKSFISNTTGGLTRVVDVYDQNGKLLKSYEGKIDVKDTEYGNKVLFDLNGKRTVIYNGTVIVQEK